MQKVLKKKERITDMTQGNPLKHILMFALPMIAGNIFQQLYSLVDTLVVGRVEGVTALAAVSSAGWLDWMIVSIAWGLAQGCSILVSQHFGAGDEKALKRAVGQSILLGCVLAVLLSVLSQIILMPALRLMQAPENTIHMTETYLRIIYSGLALVTGLNVTSGFLRALGDSRTPLLAMVASALCNIVLDILFVAVWGWGVVGVAAATIISQGLSFAVCLTAICRIKLLHPAREDMKADVPVLRELLRLGVPIAFAQVIISFGGMVLQSVVNSFGFIFMAGFSAAGRLSGLIEMAGTAIGTAMGTFTGQNYGAGRLDRVKKGERSAAVVAVAIAWIVAILLFLFGKQLVALFIEDDPAIVEQVLDFAYQYLVVMGIGLFTLYLLYVYRYILQGLGDTNTPMMSGFVELALRIGLALGLPCLIGVWGAYIAEVSAWAGAAVLLIWGYYRRMRILEKQQVKV